MQQTLSTAQVAAKAGVHRDTLLRWLREGSVPEPRRDRRGWRVFTLADVEVVVEFARGLVTSDTLPQQSDPAITRLEAIEWDFASAKSNYLTHNLHPYPAKFIPQIPNALIQELSSVGETVADIFCGSGTTLLEALQLKRHSIGIDASPLAVLISRAKTTPLTEAELDELSRHRTSCARLLERVESPTGDLFLGGDAFRSTEWRPDYKTCEFWFEPFVVEELAELRSLVSSLSTASVRTFCEVALSAIIVAVSKQDSDTRYVRRPKAIHPGDTVRRYLGQIDASTRATQEMSALLEDRFKCDVIGSSILESPETDTFDLVVTSPPYPNAYSYHLYHRTRLVWLGHDPEELKRVEIGSHRKYSAPGRKRATPETFRDECEAIFEWLRNHLRDRRYACFVIGDSTIRGQKIDNTSILSDSGAKVGFREVSRIKRNLAPTRKAFNPKIGRIKTEKILILQKV